MEEEYTTRIGSSKFKSSIETEGCLINYNKIKVGDILFHITRGVAKVINVDYKLVYPITYVLPESINPHREYQCSTSGKHGISDLYPTIYSKDPFKYTLELLRKKQDETEFKPKI